jgi:tripartite-type tricarboxylate transporter receptor subunit TctC
MKRFSLALAVATIIGGVTAASAQNYPSRPITVVVAFAAGGSGDTIMRICGRSHAQYARPDDRD